MNRMLIVIFLLFVGVMKSAANEPVYSADNNAITEFNNKLMSGEYDIEASSLVELEYDVAISLNNIESVKTVLVTRYYPTVDAAHTWGTANIYYNASNSRLVLKAAATFTPDQSGGFSVNHIDQSDLKVLDSDNYNTFTEGKELLVPFKNLVTGSYTVLEYEITKTMAHNKIGWYERFYPQNLYTRKSFSLAVNWGNTQPPYFSSSSPFVHCEQSETGVRCSGNKIPEAVTDQNVYWQDELGVVNFSSDKSWSDVVNKADLYFNNAFGLSETAVKNVFESLGLDDDTMSTEQIIEALHGFVSRDIRYLSRSENGHAVVPHNTSETLERGYGDCKDKTALLIDLLKHKGIDSFPVLVNTEQRRLLDHRAPSLAQFNHAIVCLNLGGKEHCLDETDSYTPWNVLSTGIQGKYSLSVKPGSVTRLLPVDESTWDFQVQTSVSFRPDGGQLEEQKRVYAGHSAAAYRQNIAPYSDEERKRLISESYQNTVSDLSKPTIEYSDSYAESNDFLIQSLTEYPPFLDTNADLVYSENDAWIRKNIKNQKVSNTYYEQQVFGVNIRSEYEFDLGELWDITIPTAELHLESEFGSMTRSIQSLEDNTVQIRTHLKLKSTVIVPDEITAYNGFLKTLENESVISLYGSLKE